MRLMLPATGEDAIAVVAQSVPSARSGRSAVARLSPLVRFRRAALSLMKCGGARTWRRPTGGSAPWRFAASLE